MENLNIKLIDSFCTGVVHTQFNASLLAMLSIKYVKVLYYASKSSKENIYKLCSKKYGFDDKVAYKSIFVWNGDSRYDLLIRYIISVVQNIRFLLFSNTSDLLVFNYNNPLSLRLTNLINKILNRNIMIFCHGELEMLLPDKSEGGLLYKLLRKRVCHFFLKTKTINNKINFVVLGESVYRNIQKIVTDDKFIKFNYIDHPYIYANRSYEKLQDNNVGMIGSFSISKGSDLFLKLATKLKEWNKNNVKLSITGRIFEDITELEKLNVDLPSNKGKCSVPMAEFYRRIDRLRFVLLLYPNDSYKLIASGAIMDAIDFECPIIGLKNQYFEYMFSKYGKLGCLFDNLDAIYDFLNSNEYLRDVNIDFKSVKQSTSPEYILKQLDDILRKKLNL